MVWGGRMQLLLLITLAMAAAPAHAHALPVEAAAAAGNASLLAATAAAAAAERASGMATFGAGTTGGAGGAVHTVWDCFALRDAVAGDAPRVVQVRGRIDLTPLFVASPGVWVDVGSHKTIVGGDREALITGGGLRIQRQRNVIVQNIRFHNAISYAPGERPDGSGGIVTMANVEFTEIDSILITQSLNVWVDHNEFADDPWRGALGPAIRLRHDGSVDIVRGSNYITVSNNLFRHHNKVMLIGNSDSNAAEDHLKLMTSVSRNWFRGVQQRNPRVRFGRVHVVNNLYTDIGGYAIGVGAHASIVAERNVFLNTLAWRYPTAAATTGQLRAEVNLLLSGSSHHALPADVPWQPSQFFVHQALAIGSVEAHVRANAGVW